MADFVPPYTPPCDPSAKPGYTFDPYSDPSQLMDIHNPIWPFHNFRQIHISENAFYSGYRATSFKELVDCPPLWSDVSHYWAFMSVTGYVSQEFLNPSSVSIKVGAAIALIEGYLQLKNYGVL